MSEDLKVLIQKRGLIKGRLTVFKKHLTDFKNYKEVSKQQVKEMNLRLNKIQALFEEFDSIQTSIEMAKEVTQEQILARDEVENQFYSVISTAQELLDFHSAGFDDAVSEQRSVAQKKASSACGPSGHLSGVKLPTIKLPIFDGNYSKWLEFKDSFVSLIHGNDSLTEIHKFQYLRASLEGKAAQVIGSLETSTNNYAIAWKLITERFDNKRLLVNSHLKSLCNVESITKESHASLRFLVDHISRNLRALNNLDEPTDNWDSLVIFMFSSKLDAETNKKWEEYRNSMNKLPKLDEFYAFLRSRADILETLAEKKIEKTVNIEREFKREDKYQGEFKRIYKNQGKFVATASGQRRCPICNDEHGIFQCKVFNDMSVDQRGAEVSKRRLCINCFRPGHFAYQCHMRPCKICHKYHNSMLHKSAVIEKYEGNGSNVVSMSTAVANQVLLSTAKVKIVNPETRQSLEARCLLDCGSQSSFITKSLKDRLSIRGHAVHSQNVAGLNNIAIDAKENCKFELESCNSSFRKQVSALVIHSITGDLPSAEIDTRDINIPPNIKLADTRFNCPAPVDVLIGADLFWDIISHERLGMGHNQPYVQNSKLGWLVVGPVKSPSNKICCNFNRKISNTLKRSRSWKSYPPARYKQMKKNKTCNE